MRACLIIIITTIGVALHSCKPVPENNNTATVKQPVERRIWYMYTDHDDKGNPLDSLKVYADDEPFEESLELYTDTDTLDKTILMMVHMGIFKVEGQRFAVITDTTGTSFFKFEKGRYNKIFSATPAIAFMIDPMKFKDYNADGYTDVYYSVSSGGSYGADDFLLFFDPKKRTLIYNEEPALQNIEIKGDKVMSGIKFLWTTYTIKGNKLVLSEKMEYLQGEDSDKKAIAKYNEAGAVISIDTLAVE